MARWTAETKNIHRSTVYFLNQLSQNHRWDILSPSLQLSFFFFYRISLFGVKELVKFIDTLYIDFGLMKKRCLFTHCEGLIFL